MDGIPITKLVPGGALYDLLEHWTLRELTERSNLQRSYLPMVVSAEKELLLEEIANKPICVVFDETTIIWVNFCVIVVYVDDNGRVL